VRTSAVVAGDPAPAVEAAVARLLARLLVPAARVVAGPSLVDGWTVTVWEELEVVDGADPVGAATLGALAARLHEATSLADSEDVAECDPAAAARRQIGLARAAGASSDGDLALLDGEVARVEALWRVASDEADRALTHGDLHHGNVVAAVDGPVLVDLELAGWGPRAYDAAPTVAFVRWYGRPVSDLAAFDAASGDRLTAKCIESGLDDVWRAWSASWSVANRHRSAEAETEALVRLETLRTGTAPRPWVLH
jgi:aminoglycoside phosphotransferase (APT) family kinase protein